MQARFAFFNQAKEFAFAGDGGVAALYQYGYSFWVRPVIFLGDSLACLRDFPDQARTMAGYWLREVQKGQEPGDWKPMKTVGPGVRELRVRDAGGAFRVIYVANFKDSVVVLHAFQKKTQQTAQKDIDLAAARLRALKG